ncbi:glycosyltransferase [Winogradskyella ouciana]|uniref:glycosyltransferase n=1 Tax=Winogradskyella ouciana TaxID=2608631 RepID=UPI003D29E724
MKTLTIISHTEHYKDNNGQIVGLGSTVTEINNLVEVFDHIIHVAMLHNVVPPPSSLPYTSDKITFVALPTVGGNSLKNKLKIIANAPKMLKIVKQNVKKTDYFQFRAPTGIGVFVIPYLVLFSSKKGWFKYAGNWKQKNAPKSYGFQRWLLKNQKRKVTINGKWPNQPKQCLTFENPCITNQELKEGRDTIAEKSIDGKFEFCFVGRLEEEKGLDLLIEAFKSLPKLEKQMVKSIHIVGNGHHKKDYIAKAKETDVNFKFYGYLPRKEVQKVYCKSHCIILPSASEGFPKVISEAMNYGCLPIVSNISSIDNYIINGKNGFLLEQISSESIVKSVHKVLSLSATEYCQMIKHKRDNLLKFTYSYYNKRILKEIID